MTTVIYFVQDKEKNLFTLYDEQVCWNPAQNMRAPYFANRIQHKVQKKNSFTLSWKKSMIKGDDLDKNMGEKSDLPLTETPSISILE